MTSTLVSPVASAFPNIQWDALGSLRLTAQETALLRMAETNPIDYTLADSRDASMYARVLLKLLAEAAAAGAGTGMLFLVFTCSFLHHNPLFCVCIVPISCRAREKSAGSTPESFCEIVNLKFFA